MSYGNFQDPVGLLKRMLKSGNRAAYFTLFREGMSVLLTPMDMLLAPLERRRLRKKEQSDLPVILILGGSRSGTTLLYQTLAQYLPVSYFNNLSASFQRAPITGGKWFNWLVSGSKRKKNFKNYYGSVSGFDGPNDGFHIWNRWLGEDRNAVPENIPAETLADMQQFVQTWHVAFGKPLLNKNNRNSLCVPLFDRTFPKGFFIEIRRDPVYVVQSLIQSREAVQGSKYVAWGLSSTDSDQSNDPLSYVDDICRQVHQVEMGLKKERESVSPDKYIRITYEDFCSDPAMVLNSISQKIWGRPLSEKELAGLKPFKNTNRQKISDEEFQRILTRVSELYGAEAIQHVPAPTLS